MDEKDVKQRAIDMANQPEKMAQYNAVMDTVMKSTRQMYDDYYDPGGRLRKRGKYKRKHTSIEMTVRVIGPGGVLAERGPEDIDL